MQKNEHIMSMVNRVTETCKPKGYPMLGSLRFGEVFQYPKGDAYYMRIDGGTVHLGTGMVYSVPLSKEVRSVPEVTITRDDPKDC